jgi:hypothetical protein
MPVEILNNRELAITFWLIVIFVYLLFAKKMREVRKDFKRLLSALFVRQKISISLLMLIYMGLMVYALSEVRLWNVDQIKNTVFWCASVGFVSLFKIETKKVHPG